MPPARSAAPVSSSAAVVSVAVAKLVLLRRAARAECATAAGAARIEGLH
jgi:hypothetical protein